MRKSSVILVLATIISLASAVAEPVKPKNDASATPKYLKESIIANFDSGSITVSPNWWTFDRIKTSFVESKDPKFGNYVLKIGGNAENYYVGGMGTYVGKDASDFDTLVVSVYGSGANSGTLRLQVYDDDNNTYQLEQDSTYKVLNDDYLEYELPVTWEGWRTVEIPLSRFVDMNPGIGDDVINIDQKDGSGGLLHFQFVVLSNTQTGNANLMLDNIKLVKTE